MRGDASERFLGSSDWTPDSERIIAHARHLGIYAAAIYDDGHKVEYLVCDERAVPEINVTRFSVMLDRGGIREAMHQAKTSTLARQQQAHLDANPANVAIILATAASRAERGEILSATAWTAMAADTLLIMLAAQNRQTSALSDPLDSRRRLEKVRPDLAASLTEILRLPPSVAVFQLANFANNAIRPETSAMNWRPFDIVMATVKPKPGSWHHGV